MNWVKPVDCELCSEGTVHMSAVVSCQVTSHVPQLSRPLNLLILLHTGALQIENSEESDQGKYECVAMNSAGTRYSAPANLYVRGTVNSSLQTTNNDALCDLFYPAAMYLPQWYFHTGDLRYFGWLELFWACRSGLLHLTHPWWRWTNYTVLIPFFLNSSAHL